MTKTYNFDEIIDRSGSGDLKHEALHGGDEMICYLSGWLIWILLRLTLW